MSITCAGCGHENRDGRKFCTGALTYEPCIREELGRLHDDPAELREALRLYSAIGATGHAQRLGSTCT